MIDKKSYSNLLDESFPGIKANIIRWEALGFSWSSVPFLKEKNGKYVSHVGFLEYPLLIDGRQSNVGALHAICTEITHRNLGLASTLIQEVLKWANDRYEFVVLFTEIPQFYEKLSFKYIQEYRFQLPCQHTKGSQSLTAVISPKDNPLFMRMFKERAPVSNHVWMKDDGMITSFNALFATYPTYWSLHYSSSIDGFISYLLEDKTLHLFDIIASKIPSLDLLLDHFPTSIDKIYFYCYTP
ncbi:MAG: GNAT family N-acetyltransferase [Parachlamydiaceae bacterium]|nr:GNAT family N-acetyltransferase [Parachlamydiaceae bacterium]